MTTQEELAQVLKDTLVSKGVPEVNFVDALLCIGRSLKDIARTANELNDAVQLLLKERADVS